MQILKVLIEHSAEEIDRTFDYLLNEQRNVKGCSSLSSCGLA